MMFLVKRCFAPCFTVKKSNCISLECGSKLIAFYTAFLHFVVMFYCADLLRGGRSDDVASPFFHMDKSIKPFATFGIIYCVCFIFFSFLLYLGIKKEIRFLYLFWIICTLVELLGIFFTGLFLIYRYRYFSYAIFSFFTLWIYGSYHFYLWWVIISQYYYLKVFQEPTFLVLYT